MRWEHFITQKLDSSNEANGQFINVDDMNGARKRTADEADLASHEATFVQEEADDDDDESGGVEESGKSTKRSGRRKIKIEFIEDKSRRHITFSKRKAGIMKKAYELSTLTGTQVLLLVASETGHVYTFATPKLQPLITQPTGKNLIQACLNAAETMPVGSSSGPIVQQLSQTRPTPPLVQQQQQQNQQKKQPSSRSSPVLAPQQQEPQHVSEQQLHNKLGTTAPAPSSSSTTLQQARPRSPSDIHSTSRGAGNIVYEAYGNSIPSINTSSHTGSNTPSLSSHYAYAQYSLPDDGKGQQPYAPKFYEGPPPTTGYYPSVSSSFTNAPRPMYNPIYAAHPRSAAPPPTNLNHESK
ncbi:hypothetical protein SmJEL517_g05524 [Synchytrium microbalum]|uniref:MADS-box domain-containing protein n=1 Tax=Synchytrium microbalum TaxID=1806994 RepID=A0A507C0M5_9FUNG|nr:uncharacterized protein SmJEL517_g05524 [Synchytrium microbalum]TPX31083.1 hypothetical protein SmJEL517_g05524 [Synchytrium microbalum]